MLLYAQCACGEAHPSALRDISPDDVQCANCVARAAGRREMTCPWCGTMAPFVGHHANGPFTARKIGNRIKARQAKKASKETVKICCNCHAKEHSHFEKVAD